MVPICSDTGGWTKRPGAPRRCNHHHNDGTYYNPTLGQPGAFPITTNAVLFNGTNSYVALPYSYTLGMLGDFTAMAWVNPANANGSLPVFGTDSTSPTRDCN